MVNQIRFRAGIRQVLSFEGMPIEGTDIDFMSELGDRAYVIGEVKRAGATWPRGQNILLERLTKDLIRAGKRVLTLRAEHECEATEDVILSTCSVLAYLDRPKWGGRWQTPREPWTVGEFVEDYLDRWGMNRAA